MVRADLPDYISWQNLGVTAKSRRVRSCINWSIAFVLVLCSMIGIVIMKNKTTELKNKYNTDIQCPDDSWKLKNQAFLDMQKDISDRAGIMHCFCMESIKHNLKEKKTEAKMSDTMLIEFPDFEEKGIYYC